MNKIVLAIATISSVLALSACDIPQDAKDTQAQLAQNAANSIKFTANAEIDNIKRRLELTSNPGQIGFILLINEMGRPVMYTGVRGKVTSGSKRLTKPQEYLYAGSGGVVDAPSDEGTYGSSNPYIYFWTTGGQYIQWSGHYLYSDKPFRIDDPALIILSK